ncbi:hypothetical protein BDR03DRAFT_972936 [Suillus americanus]|nr:hypothetical protein BDR03DRAFT_972936 [Suillus americanus]
MSGFYHYPSNGGPAPSTSAPGRHSPDELFQCMWVCPTGLHCNALIRGYNLSTHLREAHGLHGSDKSRCWCLWNSCNREFNKESVVRHVEEIHLGIGYSCNQCGAAFSRRDTLNRHSRACSGDQR